MQRFTKSNFWKTMFKDIFSQQSSKDMNCYSKKTNYVFTTLNKFTKSKSHKFYNAHMVEKKFHHPTRTTRHFRNIRRFCSVWWCSAALRHGSFKKKKKKRKKNLCYRDKTFLAVFIVLKWGWIFESVIDK